MSKTSHRGNGNAASNSNSSSFDLDHVSPATRLLEKRRQMFEVQEALDKKKDEFARQQVGVTSPTVVFLVW